MLERLQTCRLRIMMLNNMFQCTEAALFHNSTYIITYLFTVQ